MGLESYHIGAAVLAIQETTNLFFTFIFGLEAIVQLCGTHPRQYFTDGFNTFDVTIVLASFATVAFEATLNEFSFVNPRMLRIVRVFRILRTLRAIRILKSLQDLSAVSAVIFKSYMIIFNLLLLLTLIFFTFGILGVALFSHMCSAPYGPGSASSSSYSAYSPSVFATRCDLVDPVNYLSPNSNFEHLGWCLCSS